MSERIEVIVETGSPAIRNGQNNEGFGLKTEKQIYAWTAGQRVGSVER